MGFRDPPPCCSFVEGKFQHIQEISDKIKQHYASTRNFHFINVFVLLLVVVIAAYVFNCVFENMFKKVMHNRVDQIVEEQINAYKNIGNETDRTMEMNSLD